MKKLLSRILAAVMLLSAILSSPTLSALAESVFCEELGFAIDFDTIADRSEYYMELARDGVIQKSPYTAAATVYYCALPKETVRSMTDTLYGSGQEEYELILNTLSTLTADIATVLVTDADSLEEAGIRWPLPDGFETAEFGSKGDYHFYFITHPLDQLTAVLDITADTGMYGNAPIRAKEAALRDVETARSELLGQLLSAELSVPTEPVEEFVGQVIQFETTDLDGNPVSSADLFRDNKVTMVNVWGTWCGYCLDEMADLAEIHARLQEKGCGIVGVEYERQSIENVADTARRILAEAGVGYPNVIGPKNDPVFSRIQGFPTTFFVDSEGRILTDPISGAAVSAYEPTVEMLLAGTPAEEEPGSAEAEEPVGEYRVIVRDRDGKPVKGAVIQLCDDSACYYRKTGADGIAAFQVASPNAYDVHVLQVPDGYAADDGAYRTPETFSDLEICLDKAA